MPDWATTCADRPGPSVPSLAVRVSRRFLPSAVGALALFFAFVPAALAVDGSALRASLDRDVNGTGAARTGALAFDLTTGSTL